MGHFNHLASRPIVGETAAGVGATYIIVDRYQDDINVQVTANGTVTFTVDWTIDNILWDTAAQAAVNLQNRPDLVDPASAAWTNLIGSGGVDAAAQLDNTVFALRIDITAGTGSVAYRIAQA